MPDMVPGKARDFMLRVTCTRAESIGLPEGAERLSREAVARGCASGENEIVFAGAEAFEGEEGALEPPGDGETVVYFFTVLNRV